MEESRIDLGRAAQAKKETNITSDIKEPANADAMEATDGATAGLNELTITKSKGTDVVDEIGGISEKDNDSALAATGTPKAESGERSSDKSTTTKKLAYILVDDEEGLKQCLDVIRKDIESDALLSLDCEGDNLSRAGELQLISVATRRNVFLVDIKALKTQPFEDGLRAIIENADIKKLMFDCREDSDALFHQFNVKLAGVLDIQLLEVIKKSPDVNEPNSRRRRCEREEEIVRVKGLLECIELYTKSKAFLKAKGSAVGKQSDWGQRPLQTSQLRYAATDVLSLFRLYDKLSPNEEEMKRLEIASAIYTDLKRSLPTRANDSYENNGFLPVDVVPPKGHTSFACGGYGCTKCHRRFPREEFSNTQLRNGTQMCRTCKVVKQDVDRRESRRLNYEIARGRREQRQRQRELDNMPRGFSEPLYGGVVFYGSDYDNFDFFI